MPESVPRTGAKLRDGNHTSSTSSHAADTYKPFAGLSESFLVDGSPPRSSVDSRNRCRQHTMPPYKPYPELVDRPVRRKRKISETCTRRYSRSRSCSSSRSSGSDYERLQLRNRDQDRGPYRDRGKTYIRDGGLASGRTADRGRDRDGERNRNKSRERSRERARDRNKAHSRERSRDRNLVRDKAPADDRPNNRDRTRGKSRERDQDLAHRIEKPSHRDSRRGRACSPLPASTRESASKSRLTQRATSPGRYLSSTTISWDSSARHSQKDRPPEATASRGLLRTSKSGQIRPSSRPRARQPSRSRSPERSRRAVITFPPSKSSSSSKIFTAPLPPLRESKVVPEAKETDSHEQKDGPPANGEKSSVKQPSRHRSYISVSQVGEGTYGKVFKGRDMQSETLVALKRIRIEREKSGFPITALREIKLLQSLSHPNIVALLDLAVDHDAIYIVFEYLEHDLAGLTQHPSIRFDSEHVRCISRQMFKGLEFLHKRKIIHRDLKGSNLLLGCRGQLKLADFGLARCTKKASLAMTNRVITLWYRPLELLFGSIDYTSAIDIWSAGCILLELFLRRTPFSGVDELSQIEAVYKVCGTPDLSEWPECADLPWYGMLKPPESRPRVLLEKFAELVPQEELALADWMLKYNPSSRPSATEILQKEYFARSPLDDNTPIEKLLASCLVTDEWHEFESKQRRRKLQLQHQAKPTAALESQVDAAGLATSAAPAGVPETVPINREENEDDHLRSVCARSPNSATRSAAMATSVNAFSALRTALLAPPPAMAQNNSATARKYSSESTRKFASSSSRRHTSSRRMPASTR